MAVATATPQTTPGSKHNVQVARQAYYDKISKFHMAPLWEVLKDLVTPEPKTECRPAMWKFSDVKKLMLEAGDVISAEEAERRVLVLENPGETGKARITNSLFAGIQLILPGEIADVHQHSASAIRFVLDGEGAYTAVDGEKTMMSHGDFIITANWAPHDHGNPGKQPVMWLDVLDMPTVNHFETSFAEHSDEKMQKTSHADGDSFDRYASGVLPDGAPAHAQPQPGDQLPLRQDAADPGTAEEDRRHRQAPRRARALRQSDQRRPGAADHGRLSRAAAERLQGRALSFDRRHHLRGRRGPGHHHHRRQAVRLGRQRRVRGAAVEALSAQRGQRSRCCSRFPTARRRKRSASGAKGTRASATAFLYEMPRLRRLRCGQFVYGARGLSCSSNN